MRHCIRVPAISSATFTQAGFDSTTKDTKEHEETFESSFSCNFVSLVVSEIKDTARVSDTSRANNPARFHRLRVNS